MLYYSFVNSVNRLLEGCTDIVLNSEPSPGEEVPETVSVFLGILKETNQSLHEINQILPDTLEGYTDKRFGPSISQLDLHKVLSTVVPLADRLGKDCPAWSYAPVDLFRSKNTVIVETVSLYYEWKATPIIRTSSNRKTISFLDDFNEKSSGVEEDSKLMLHLLSNINESIEIAKQDMESKLGLKISLL